MLQRQLSEFQRGIGMISVPELGETAMADHVSAVTTVRHEHHARSFIESCKQGPDAFVQQDAIVEDPALIVRVVFPFTSWEPRPMPRETPKEHPSLGQVRYGVTDFRNDVFECRVGIQEQPPVREAIGCGDIGHYLRIVVGVPQERLGIHIASVGISLIDSDMKCIILHHVITKDEGCSGRRLLTVHSCVTVAACAARVRRTVPIANRRYVFIPYSINVSGRNGAHR